MQTKVHSHRYQIKKPGVNERTFEVLVVFAGYKPDKRGIDFVHPADLTDGKIRVCTIITSQHKKLYSLC